MIFLLPPTEGFVGAIAALFLIASLVERDSWIDQFFQNPTQPIFKIFRMISVIGQLGFV